MRLDRPAQAAVVHADPDVAIAGHQEPVLIDEWQLAPEVLGAIKRSIDADPRPGRFILTGSVRAELSDVGWPATGRVVRIPLFGLCQRELVGSIASPSLIDRAFAASLEASPLPDPVPDLADYVKLALRGGFPDVALRAPGSLGQRWLRGYVDQVVQRDAAAAGQNRDPQLLRRYLQAIAANTAGIVEHKTLYDAAGIDRLTAVAYDGLLEMLFVTERVPAWVSNRLARLTRTPKRYLIEPALLGPLTGLDERGALRDIDLLGRLLDTFVMAQLRAELEICEPPVTIHHLRLEHGRREADIVLEATDGRVVAIEVKATSAPTRSMAGHLAWLRDALGARFVQGVLLHTGPRPFRLDDRIMALPMCALWGAGSGSPPSGKRTMNSRRPHR
jgi:predicted AAA+ superfamily ATPase